MEFTFTGKNFNISDNIKNKVGKKLTRLEKLFQEGQKVAVTIKLEKIDHIIEVTIPLQKRILRAEVRNTDLSAAIDEVVDILEKQMVRYKGRLRDLSRKEQPFKDEFSAVFSKSDIKDSDEDPKIRIEKTKRFALKPMDAEEAVMEMELIGHSFFVFRNSQTDEVNVVYKRKDNSYGLIEP